MKKGALAKTYMATPKDVKPSWHLLDAEGALLGELAVKAASFLIGKHKPTYTPHIDCGDCVVVINAEKIKVTRNKETNKMYYRHSMFPGGYREENFAHLLQRKPTAIIEKAVKGMLPKNKLQDGRMHRLKVVVGSEHEFPVPGQKPKTETNN
jgi:large subunit ribosomal protein L13